MRLCRAAVTSAALLILTLGAGLAACGNDAGDTDEPGSNGTIRVLGSTSIIADWVKQVGGDHVDIDSIVPMNTDVHAFVVAPADIQKIGDADLIFVVGEHLESGFQDEVATNANGDVVVLSEGMALDQFPEAIELDHSHDDDEDDHGHEDDDHSHEDDGHQHGDVNPHIWMDLDLAIQAVERIRDTLIEVDPGNAADYEARADDYIATLRDLDEEIGDTLAGLPENRRYIVTFHDAYGYFATRYGLTLLGFVVENPEEQPSAARYASLVDEIREHDVQYLYTEPQFDARVVDQLAQDTGAEVRRIPSDALSDETPDFISMMRAIASGIAD